MRPFRAAMEEKVEVGRRRLDVTFAAFCLEIDGMSDWGRVFSKMRGGRGGGQAGSGGRGGVREEGGSAKLQQAEVDEVSGRSPHRRFSLCYDNYLNVLFLLTACFCRSYGMMANSW